MKHFVVKVELGRDNANLLVYNKDRSAKGELMKDMQEEVYSHMPLFRVWRCVSVFYQKSANSAYFVLLQRRIPAQKGLKFFIL